MSKTGMVEAKDKWHNFFLLWAAECPLFLSLKILDIVFC